MGSPQVLSELSHSSHVSIQWKHQSLTLETSKDNAFAVVGSQHFAF